MARMILGFLLVWGSVMLGVTLFREMSGKEKWALIKLLTFGGVCAIITSVLLMALVILF